MHTYQKNITQWGQLSRSPPPPNKATALPFGRSLAEAGAAPGALANEPLDYIVINSPQILIHPKSKRRELNDDHNYN